MTSQTTSPLFVMYQSRSAEWKAAVGATRALPAPKRPPGRPINPKSRERVRDLAKPAPHRRSGSTGTAGFILLRDERLSMALRIASNCAARHARNTDQRQELTQEALVKALVILDQRPDASYALLKVALRNHLITLHRKRCCEVSLDCLIEEAA